MDQWKYFSKLSGIIYWRFKVSGLNRETGESGIKTYSEIKSLIVN